MNINIYREDFHAWALQNAQLLREGRLAEIDIENIAEELEDMGGSKERELESRLGVLLAHLLKWVHQPERRCPHRRDRLCKRIDDSRRSALICRTGERPGRSARPASEPEHSGEGTRISGVARVGRAPGPRRTFGFS